MNKRYEYIDIAKGIGILLVVYGHILLLGPVHKYIYSFHMPLFFFLSGMVFNPSKYTDLKFLLKDKAKKIIVPYLIFSIITYLYWFFIERYISGSTIIPINALINIFLVQGSDAYLPHNPALWFLPCLTIVNIIFYIIYTKLKKNNFIVIILLILSVLGNISVMYFPDNIVWCIDVALTGTVFFGFGYILKNYFNNLSNIKNSTPIYGIISLILCYIISTLGNSVSLANNYYSNYILFYIGSILGIYGIIDISINMQHSKVLPKIGKLSLIILGIHIPIKRGVMGLTSKILSIDMNTLKESILISFIDTVIVMGIIAVIIRISKLISNYSSRLIKTKQSL